MNLTELQEQIILTKTKLYNLKTKKAINKARNTLNKLENEAMDILYNASKAYNEFSIKGTVIYSDYEEAYVNTVYGRLNVSLTCDVNSKSWYPQTCCISYNDGQSVIVECRAEVDTDRLKLIIVPKRVYGGTVDESRYQDLCKQDNLAFFKYPNGTMSGLFK